MKCAEHRRLRPASSCREKCEGGVVKRHHRPDVALFLLQHNQARGSSRETRSNAGGLPARIEIDARSARRASVNEGGYREAARLPGI